VTSHWREYGRNYYTRHDYEEVDSGAAQGLMDGLLGRLPSLSGQHGIATADDFSYLDPVDQSFTSGQGIRLVFDNGSRIIYRLSGTGTAGATLRVYIEKYEADPHHHGIETQTALAQLVTLANSLASIEPLTGRSAPTVIT
jgi:phosphoglucomutase